MSETETNTGAIGVGAVGTVRPGEDVQQRLQNRPGFAPVAFCDEGCEEGPEGKPIAYYQDYNLLLKDPAVELILVQGPVEKRKDFAVRALNAGRHVVVEQPFASESYEAERIMKTALKDGLVATCDLPSRNDPDFVALKNAIEVTNVGGVYAVEGFRLFPREAQKRHDLLESSAFAMLDQLQMLIEGDVKSVSTHVYRPQEGRPVQHFCIHVSMRGYGWAALQGSAYAGANHPGWTAYAPGMVFTAEGGEAAVHEPEGSAPVEQGPAAADFWENLYGAIRDKEELKCHPAQIVRAMKLHEAVLESARLGEPVVL